MSGFFYSICLRVRVSNIERKKVMATKKTTKKTVKKAKNMKNISQAHGKLEKEDMQPSTLDQVWGDTGVSKYSTMNKDEYVSQLNEFNSTDLQYHASTVGVIPVQNREMLQKRLLKEFEKHVASYQKPASVNKKIKLSKEVEDILAEGR